MNFSLSCFWFLIFFRSERGQGVHWCDLGLWGWSACGGSQGGSHCLKPLPYLEVIQEVFRYPVLTEQDSYFPDYFSRNKNPFQELVTKFHLFVGRCHFPIFNIQILDNDSGLLRWWFPFSVYIFQLIQDIPKWSQLFLIKSNSIWSI